jgi:hypothetical protein
VFADDLTIAAFNGIDDQPVHSCTLLSIMRPPDCGAKEYFHLAGPHSGYSCNQLWVLLEKVAETSFQREGKGPTRQANSQFLKYFRKGVKNNERIPIL